MQLYWSYAFCLQFHCHLSVFVHVLLIDLQEIKHFNFRIDANSRSNMITFNCPLTYSSPPTSRHQTMQHAYEAHKSKIEGKYSPVCGVKGYLWFMFIPGFDIIKGIAVDYMHCALLGVTKMLMTLWFNKSHATEC